MGAGAIRAGRAFVELFADDTKLQGTLKRTSANMRRWGVGLAAIGATITASFFAMTKSFAEGGAALDDMSQRTGFAVETLSKLDFAATQSGTSLDSLERGLIGMARFTDNAGRGLSTATDTLEALGLTVDDLKNKDPEKLFRMLAARIAAVEDPTMKQALAMQVFGKSGQALIPTLADVGKLMDEAQARGLVITAEQATEAAKLDDALDALTHQFKQIVVTVGSALAPLLTEHVESVGQNVKAAADWIKENEDLVVTLFKIGVAVKVGGTLLIGMSTLISLGTTVVGVIGKIATAGPAAGAGMTTAAAGATTLNTSLTALLGTARVLLPLLLALQFAKTGIEMANPRLTGGGRINKTPDSPETRGEARLRNLLQGTGEFAKPGAEGQQPGGKKGTGPFALDMGILPGRSPEDQFQIEMRKDKLAKERIAQEQEAAESAKEERERAADERKRADEERQQAMDRFRDQAMSAIDSGKQQLQGQLQTGTFSADIRARHFDQRQQVEIELRDLSQEQRDLLIQIAQKLELV